LGEQISSIKATKLLVKRIAHNFRLPYYTLTPTFSVCPEHGYVKGKHFNCPTLVNGNGNGTHKCGKQTEVFSRVVGYFRPVQHWNNGKREEFNDRVPYIVQ
jgi:ribonucleoside-triphosphate reductase